MENQNGWADLAQALAQIGLEGERMYRVRTGFHQVDKLLGGGIAPGLAVLGGMPGVGKSTFCLQLAGNVAMSGNPVLYFSLEMPELWIMAKAISRRLFQKGSSVTAAGVMGGSEGGILDEEQWKQVDLVKESGEFRPMLENLHVWTSPLSAADIKMKAKQFEWESRKKPIVIVDYLQIVPSEDVFRNKSDKEKNDEKVRQFTQLAHEDKFTVILISSLNRSSYTGPMQISAFKETGGIEYSADLLLGLQFRNHKKNANLTMERGKDPREVELAVLKNRYGSSGSSVPMDYYAANDCFREKKIREPKEVIQEKEESKAEEKKPARGGFIDNTVNNTLVASEIRKGAYGRRSCEVMHKTDERAAVCVQYELSEHLTCLDCCVADAVYTIAKRWKGGLPKKDAALSPRELWKVISGDHRPSITKQKRQELRRSIEHLREVQLFFNCEEELKARGIAGIGPEKLREYHGPFLELDIKEQSGGAWDGAEITFKQGVLPVFLHSYGAEVNHQMISIPSILLQVTDGKRNMNNTETNTCLKRLLAQRMEIIRYAGGSEKAKYLRTISFGEDRRLLSELQLSPEGFTKAAWNQKLKRLRKDVRNILEYYVRIKYISGYENRKGSAAADSFVVTGKIRDPNQLL